MQQRGKIRVGSLLHVGCGPAPTLPSWLECGSVTTLDLDPHAKPDIVADCSDMPCVPDASYDAVYAAHTLEHLTLRGAYMALSEFRRVVVPGGVIIITVPDLQDVRPTLEVVYVAPNGVPVTGSDMHWGWSPYTDRMPYMQHKWGYVAESLLALFVDAQIAVEVSRLRDSRELMAIATTPDSNAQGARP